MIPSSNNQKTPAIAQIGNVVQNALKKNRSRRPTFSQILEASKQVCAVNAWEKAKTASLLRHHAMLAQKMKTAKRLSKLKMLYIALTADIFPEGISTHVDMNRYIGLRSVTLKGYGSLHIPNWANISCHLYQSWKSQ